jgi:hypothetical protein
VSAGSVGWFPAFGEGTVLVLRWFLDGTRVAQLAIDNAIARSTVYDYLSRASGCSPTRAPSLQSALLPAKMAGYAPGTPFSYMSSGQTGAEIIFAS